MSKREKRVWRMGNRNWRQTDSEGLLKEVTLNGDLDGEGEIQEDPGQRRQRCKGPGVHANVAWSRQREAGKAATKGKEAKHKWPGRKAHAQRLNKSMSIIKERNRICEKG